MICGVIAQLGERLVCIQKVVGSIPSNSTTFTAGIVKRYNSCLVSINSRFDSLYQHHFWRYYESKIDIIYTTR